MADRLRVGDRCTTSWCVPWDIPRGAACVVAYADGPGTVRIVLSGRFVDCVPVKWLEAG